MNCNVVKPLKVKDMPFAGSILKALTAYFPGGGPGIDTLLLYFTLSVVMFVVVYMVASR